MDSLLGTRTSPLSRMSLASVLSSNLERLYVRSADKWITIVMTVMIAVIVVM